MHKLTIINEDNKLQPMFSKADASVNWTTPTTEHGYLETRFVRREDKHFIVYLSSQSGCAMGCRMCYLTATKQTKFQQTTLQDYLTQAETVLDWYKNNSTAKATLVHFSFMARGEAFNNPTVLNNSEELFRQLGDRAQELNLLPRYLLSTIMPKSLRGTEMTDLFPRTHPELYYSLYSADEDFRKKWLPQAMDVDEALEKLYTWQRRTSKIVKIHYAFIKDENDSEETVEKVCKKIRRHELRVNFNIVRYNPYSEKYGQESDEPTVARIGEQLKSFFPESRIKIVPRVGPDVYASCGMFIPK